MGSANIRVTKEELTNLIHGVWTLEDLGYAVPVTARIVEVIPRPETRQIQLELESPDLPTTHFIGAQSLELSR